MMIDVTPSLAFFIDWNHHEERWWGLTKHSGHWNMNFYLFSIACSHPWKGKK